MATLTTPQAPKYRNGLVLDARLDEGIRVEIVTITPDMAAKWLKRNYTNRSLKRPQIARMVRALKENRWEHLNGETIIFSDQHQLLDGQHRLVAVVEAAVPITSLVVFGIQEQRRGTIDTGTGRLLADHLSLRGHANAKSLASALAFLKDLETGTARGTSPNTQALFANYEAAEQYLAQHPSLADSVRRIARLPRLIKPSHATVLDYLFAAKNATLHDAWYTTMATGMVTAPYLSFLTLRERLLRDSTEKTTRPHLEAFVYNIRAWNAERQGQHLKLFRWSYDEAIPAIA